MNRTQYEKTVRDACGDTITVEVDCGCVWIRSDEGFKHTLMELDRGSLKQLRKALKRAARLIDEQ